MEVLYLAVDYDKPLCSGAPSGESGTGGFQSTLKQSTEYAKPEDNGLRSQTREKSEDNRNRIICEQ